MTPTGKAYYPKLVWVTHSKFKRREMRRGDYGLEINHIEFSLASI